ncbi:hypothetical protein ETB97_010047 [Aspergillus alliaceus]|uniref:Uncharacterized protein n=1 Tax=Petromyces alliaceus TaxID=209559 RepID=A0A8H6E0S5_PETAA|nr:hypothetical protein ETB97_010047 [Aspergillus burnettii]
MPQPISVQLTRVFEAIGDFLWTSGTIKTGMETINDGFTAKWTAIKGIFSISEIPSDTNIFSKASSELGYLLDELIGPELDVGHVSMQKTADGWKMYLAGWECISHVAVYK